jgi:hypothetical protein
VTATGNSEGTEECAYPMLYNMAVTINVRERAVKFNPEPEIISEPSRCNMM